MLKVIIAGGREFNDYSLLHSHVSIMLRGKEVEIVSGGAMGADHLGKKYAEKNGIPIKSIPAKWDLYGKVAGPMRNTEMAKYADALIAFWDGKSKGTKDMIEKALKYNLQLNVIHY